jgi:transposase-like protein
MTEHSELRIPLQDVKLAIVCDRCKAEIVIDPKNANRDRFSGQQPRFTCSVCEQAFDSSVGRVIGQFLEAFLQARSMQGMSLAARRTNPGA